MEGCYTIILEYWNSRSGHETFLIYPDFMDIGTEDGPASLFDLPRSRMGVAIGKNPWKHGEEEVLKYVHHTWKQGETE